MRKYALALEIAGTILLIALIAGVALPAYNRSKDRAKEAEVKSNLHTIQLAVERYAIDMDGSYPQYLIGGEIPGVPDPLQNVSQEALYSDPNSKKRLLQSDPLIRRGYMGSYPKNPFVNTKSAASIANLQVEVGDPLRSGAEGDKQDYRFGKDCNVMGNVSCDYRYPEYYGAVSGLGPQKMKSYADFEGYPYYDVWDSVKPKFFLPGEFFYKSNGPVVVSSMKQLDSGNPIKPVENDLYVLGAFGSRKTKGWDVLGPEAFIYVYSTAIGERVQFTDDYEVVKGQNELIERSKSPSWLRWSDTQSSDGTYPGSPFGAPGQVYAEAPLGNQNGIKDGVISILSNWEGKETTGW